jgi:hypothetical protein
MAEQLRGQFEKFEDSPYYSESEVCGGAMTVSFSKCLPWQAMHFLNAPPTSQEDSETGGIESTNFSNGLRSCSAILQRALLKRL